MKKSALFLLFVSLITALPLFARERPQSASGKVVDSYTRELMKEFKADLLRPDSSFIKSYFPVERYSYNQPMNLDIDSLPASDCIIRVTAEGYYPQFMRVAQPGKNEWGIELRPIMMHRIPFYQPRELEEVTVTVSKLKMVMKGDTIVYNADAFALAQGSMLDGLISQLPGVELKSNGQIFVNGKFVSELLVNGENFFKGDPQIALENLPAYMVNDIRVYHRNEFMEHKQKEELPLVMDVKLKKQYQTGWIANAEAGYGTKDRFLGRLFALMFTRDSRLSLVGNVNNTNDDRKPGQTDSWNPNWQSAGRATIASGGVDYLWNSRLRSWKVEANLLARHKKSDLSSEGNSERYLSGGNLLTDRQSKQTGHEWRITTDNKITFHVPRLWVYFLPAASFEREKADGRVSSSDSDSYGNLLNSLSEATATYRRNWEVGADINGRWQLPRRPNTLSFGAGVKWNDRRLETTTLRHLLFPQQPELNDLTHPQEFMPERKLRAEAKAGYSVDYRLTELLRGGISFNYSLKHQTLDSTRDYYLLQDSSEVLPSVSDAVRKAGFVASNSYDYTLNDNDHALAVSLTNWIPALRKGRYQANFNAGVTLHYAPGSITYHQAGADYFVSRHPWYAEPEVHFNIDDFGSFAYKYYGTLPKLRDMLDVTDAANPLFIFLGNPDLKMTRCHEVYMNLYNIATKGPGLEVTYTNYRNMIAQAADYNMTTGVTTYRPVNVNGNWDIRAKLFAPWYWRRLGKWQPDLNVRALYQNSVDLIGRDLSTVRNLSVGGKAALTYIIADGLEVTATGNADWRKVTSPIESFDPISAVDFDYGVVVRAVKLPWNISVTTDLMMHSRRGYSDSRLNTNDLVWNARVAKSILQGNLTFALDGFDILGQLSNVRFTMNSQGRTETRYNTLPSYAMLHAIYRLNIQPKKK